MTNRLRITSILAFTLLHQISAIGTRPIVSLYASDLGASPAMIGLLSSVYGLGALLFAVPTGRWIDNHGGQIVTQIGIAVQACGYLLIAFGQSVQAILAGQVLSGGGFVLVVLSIQAAIADEGRGEEHSRNYAAFTTVASVAHLVGPISFGYISDHWGFPLTFIASAVVAVSALAVILLFFPRDLAGNRRKKSFIQVEGALGKRALALMKDRVLAGAIITGAFIEFAQDALVTFFPLYAKELGLSATTTGAILSARAIALLVVRPLLPIIVQRWTRAQVLGQALFWGGLSTISLGVLTSFHPLIIGGIATGATIGLCQPVTMAAVAEFAPAHARGLAFSLRMSGNRLGQIISPLFLGIFAGPLGPAAALWVSGSVLASGSLLIWRRWRVIAPTSDHPADD